MADHPAKQRSLPGIAALAIVYIAIAKLGLGLGAVSGFATLVWPPTGIALAALLLFGARLWPGIFVGAWVVNVWTGAPIAVALAIATGNTVEAVLGAYSVRRFAGFRGTFDSLRHVLGVVLGAALISTLVSATIGVSSLALDRIVQSWHQAVETWRAWWVGDVLGDLVVAPLLLTWARGGARLRLKPVQSAEALVLTALVVFISWGVFARPFAPMSLFESPYILFPLFVWAAVRFELHGATLAIALASTIAIWGTAHGAGPFAREGLAASLLALQVFMGCSALTPLVVAGATMDRTRALRVQESWVAAVSHDLKNPLSALLTSGESLLRKVPEPPVQKHHDLLRRSVDRMMRLITHLSDVSAIERRHLPLEPKPEDVRALLKDALELLRPLATAKGVVLRMEADEPLDALCDRDRVLQILSNLIGNAIKFCPEQSTVTVRAERAEQAVRVSVRDHGPGIDASELRHVFERYWHTRSSADGGSGLGLFIAKGLVEAHDGRIWVESKVGVGSTFYFSLPIRPRLSGRTLIERMLHFDRHP